MAAVDRAGGGAVAAAGPSRTCRALVLDFAGVEYISSVGLRVLMIAAPSRCAAGSARIAVAGLQPVVAEIFAISRFDMVLEVFPSRARRAGRALARSARRVRRGLSDGRSR